MIYRIRKTSYEDLSNYLDGIGITFRKVRTRNFGRTVDLETEELPISVVSNLVGRGYMVYEQISPETWWYISPEECAYAKVRQRLLRPQL